MSGNISTYNDYTDFPGTYVRRGGAGGGLPFPVKLFVLLKYIDLKEPNMQAIVSWNQHGRSFKIHNLNNFRHIILSRFFPKCSYETFRRQLNFWGFKRRTQGLLPGQPDYGSYYHEKFLRSKDYLCRLIVRKKYLKRKSRQGSDSSSCQETKADQELAGSEGEPDFLILRTMPSSEQCRLVEPESDDDLFALLLQGSNHCNSNDNSNAESPDPTLAISSSRRSSNDYSSGGVLEISGRMAEPMSISYNSALLGQYPSSIGDTSNNTQSRLDHRHFAYHNIDLQRILSDENEWQWRNLEPFPIGFQPLPTQDEVENLERFFKFVREANGQS